MICRTEAEDVCEGRALSGARSSINRREDEGLLMASQLDFAGGTFVDGLVNGADD